MAKRVWFELVDATDPRGSLTSETSLRLTSDISIIDDLRATIHSQYHHSEDSVESLDLDKVVVVERPQRQKRLKVEKPGEKQGKTEGSDIFPLDDLATLTALGQKLNRETDLVAGEIVAMPKSVFGTVFPNGLYIREEYWAVYKVIQEEMKSKEMLSRILVIGSPGIGKSVFGIFLLLVLMTERKDVAYRPLGQGPFFFSWDSVNSHYETSRLPLAGKKYEGLFDGNESGGALTLSAFRHTFLFASPRDKNFNQFVKDLCVKVYMNPWTKDECQALADAIWKTRSSTDSSLQNGDEWFHRFNLVGGKPRLLFASFEEYDDLVKSVEGAIPQNVDVLETQVRQFQRQIFDKSMEHILFLMYRDETKSSRSYLTFASSIVERMISSHYTVESAERIISLLQTPALNLQSRRRNELLSRVH